MDEHQPKMISHEDAAEKIYEVISRCALTYRDFEYIHPDAGDDLLDVAYNDLENMIKVIETHSESSGLSDTQLHIDQGALQQSKGPWMMDTYSDDEGEYSHWTVCDGDGAQIAASPSFSGADTAATDLANGNLIANILPLASLVIRMALHLPEMIHTHKRAALIANEHDRKDAEKLLAQVQRIGRNTHMCIANLFPSADEALVALAYEDEEEDDLLDDLLDDEEDFDE